MAKEARAGTVQGRHGKAVEGGKACEGASKQALRATPGQAPYAGGEGAR